MNMEKINVPTESAQEPNEEARQPEKETAIILPQSNSSRVRVNINENTQSTEISSSQNTCSYKDVLSQPAKRLSHRDKLLWLQKRRGTGLWVSCDNCNKWRYMPHVLDKHELPPQWFCELNPDRSIANCSIPEDPLNPREEEDLIHSEYSAGTVVWARLQGWPWWPAMIDDCVDTEQFYWLDGFSDIPTYYNVVFFDSKGVTRAWIPTAQLKPYSAYKNAYKNYSKKYKARIATAMKKADDADMLPVTNRLAKYSFLANYKGAIGKPSKLKNIRKEFENKINKQYDINFTDSESESDNDSVNRCESVSPKKRRHLNSNVNLVGRNPKQKIDSDATETQNEAAIIDSTDILAGSDKQTCVMNGPVNDCTLADTLDIDNDSSKTYLPDTDVAPQLTDFSELPSEVQDLQVRRISTPTSGDFEF